jgi:hypothetical protein
MGSDKTPHDELIIIAQGFQSTYFWIKIIRSLYLVVYMQYHLVPNEKNISANEILIHQNQRST